MNILEIFSGFNDLESIFCFVIVKSIFRFIFMRFLRQSPEVRYRMMIFVEHVFFSIWGFYVVVIHPTTVKVTNDEGKEVTLQSWFYHSIDCWSPQQYPFPMFRLFYYVKIGSHVEDMFYLMLTWIFPSIAFQTSNTSPEKVLNKISSKVNTKRDSKMDIHHISTAMLCIGSYVTGYVKVGSLGTLPVKI